MSDQTAAALDNLERVKLAQFQQGLAIGKAAAQADADLLNDIWRAGCPTADTKSVGSVCGWCLRILTDPHDPDCLWLRIEARGER